MSSQERKHSRQCLCLSAPVHSKVGGNDSGLVQVLKVPTTKLLLQMVQCEFYPDSPAWAGFYSAIKAFGYAFPTTMIDDFFSSCDGATLVKKLLMYTRVSLSPSCIKRSLTTRCGIPQSDFPPVLPVYTANVANIHNMKQPIPRFWCSFWLVVSKHIALTDFFSFSFHHVFNNTNFLANIAHLFVFFCQDYCP